MSKRTAAPVASTVVPESVKADAVAVVAAAQNLGGSNEVTLKGVLAEAAKTFNSAIAINLSATSDAVVETQADAAARLALEETDRLNAIEPEVPEAGDGEEGEWPALPADFRILNNSPFALSEPASGAFVPGGGSTPVTLHDKDFAKVVVENLRQLALLNYLPPGALVLQLAPRINREVLP